MTDQSVIMKPASIAPDGKKLRMLDAARRLLSSRGFQGIMMDYDRNRDFMSQFGPAEFPACGARFFLNGARGKA